MFGTIGADYMLVPGTSCESFVYNKDKPLGMFDTIQFGKFTIFMNKLSIPSVSIPTPIKHPDGMPAGIIIYGKPG